MNKKFLSLIVAVMMLFSFTMSSYAATTAYSSKSWNLYYTNASTGSHTFDSFGMNPASVYYISFDNILSTNPGRGVKVTVSGIGRFETDQSQTFTGAPQSLSRTITYSSIYPRSVDVSLLYTSGGGVVGSTGSISI